MILILNNGIAVAPLKSLVSETYKSWSFKFSSVGLKCCEITGDTSEYDDLDSIKSSEVSEWISLKIYMEASETKWANSDYILSGVNSLRLGVLHMIYHDERYISNT